MHDGQGLPESLPLWRPPVNPVPVVQDLLAAGYNEVTQLNDGHHVLAGRPAAGTGTLKGENMSRGVTKEWRALTADSRCCGWRHISANCPGSSEWRGQTARCLLCHLPQGVATFPGRDSKKLTQNAVQKLPIQAYTYICVYIYEVRSKTALQCLESYMHDVDRGVKLCNVVFENVEMKRRSQ